MKDLLKAITANVFSVLHHSSTFDALISLLY